MARIPRRKSGCYMRLFTFLFLIASLVFAASSKREELNEKFRKIGIHMNEYYENGDLEGVIELYKKNCCVDDKKAEPGKESRKFKRVKKEIRGDIYHKVALSYIALDQPGLGEIYIRKLLVLRRDEGLGDYWLSIRETAKSRYYVAPRLLVGLKLGTNFTMVQPVERYVVLEPGVKTGSDDYQKNYGFHLTYSRGLQAGAIIEYAFTKNLSISIQPTIFSRKFQYKNSFTREGENSSGEADPTTLNYTHRQGLGYLEIPLLLKFRFIKSKFNPYIQVGAHYSLLQSAIKKLQASSSDGDYQEKAIVDIKELFTKSNFGIWIGAGIGYDTGSFRFEIEVNYKHGLNNIVDEAMRYKNQQLLYAYYDVSDDIKLRSLDLSLKVLLPISFKAFKR